MPAEFADCLFEKNAGIDVIKVRQPIAVEHHVVGVYYPMAGIKKRTSFQAIVFQSPAGICRTLEGGICASVDNRAHG